MPEKSAIAFLSSKEIIENHAIQDELGSGRSYMSREERMKGAHRRAMRSPG